MSNPTRTTGTHPAPPRLAPPTKHQLALMIWLCVFPTLTPLMTSPWATGCDR